MVQVSEASGYLTFGLEMCHLLTLKVETFLLK